MRNVKFVTNEFYHIYNRGTDKRDIFLDKEDVWRFLTYLKEINSVEIIGSIFQNSFRKNIKKNETQKLVNIIAYCLNQNHFHFILEPLVEEGIQKFMHRLSTGYTNYFNKKNKRSGSLFQGTYKAIHISSNEYLLHLGVYVNLNNEIHIGMNKPWMKELSFSSFREYMDNKSKGICKKDIILGQFKSNSDFSRYCFSVLPSIIKRKEEIKGFDKMCID
jgi:REP element-mobilizing transposase RayT